MRTHIPLRNMRFASAAGSLAGGVSQRAMSLLYIRCTIAECVYV